MPKGYTSNQTGAIATLLAGILWGFTIFGVTIKESPMAMVAMQVFLVLVIIGWVLVPLYIKRIRLSYIMGIIIMIIVLIGLLVVIPTPSSSPWYLFDTPIYNFSFIIAYLIILASIYFSYKSWKELK